MLTDPILQTIFYGLLIFLARVCDVAVGTIRTLAIVQGRTTTAFILAFFEISLWLVVISTVLEKIAHNPVLGVFYSLGFATGTVVGIKLERRLSFGNIVLRVISRKNGHSLAKRVRRLGYAVTVFPGEGMSGPVAENYIVCRRRDLKEILAAVEEVEPKAFYTIEHVGAASRVYRPMLQPATGWRAVLKKK